MSLAMGPKLRAYLALPEPETFRERDPATDSEFTEWLVGFARAKGFEDDDTLGDVIDELVAMDLPRAALGLAAAFPQLVGERDFRAQLSLGVAAMLAGDEEEAEARLVLAQRVLPDEPAPYVNLVQVLARQERFDEALVWCNAGLDADRNNKRLWEYMARLLERQHGSYVGDELTRVAEKRDAWAGLAFAAKLTASGDRYHAVHLLERLYFQGEREPEFLIELTAALGVAGEYERIPTIVWQAERLAQKGLPWQLQVHAAQAQLALGHVSEARVHLEKAKQVPHLTREAREMLAELEKEADESPQ